MRRVSQGTKLTRVEYILGSGTGVLDFAVQGEDDYYTWEGTENDDWSIKNVGRIENDSEDRFTVFPEEGYFTCEISLDEKGRETVHCE